MAAWERLRGPLYIEVAAFFLLALAASSGLAARSSQYFIFLFFFFFIHSLLFDWGASLRILISILGGRNCAKTTYINLHHSNAAYIRRRGNTFQEDRKCTTGAGARSCGLYLNIWPHRAES